MLGEPAREDACASLELSPMNPTLVLTLASGLLLLLTGLTSGRPSPTEDAPAPDEAESASPPDA